MEIFTNAEFFLKLEDNHFLFIKLVQHSQKKKRYKSCHWGGTFSKAPFSYKSVPFEKVPPQ